MNLLMLMMVLFALVVCLLHLVFYLAAKGFVWESSSKSVFECGFTAYHFSRFSFPIHYFLIALTFLLLDLELCFLMPFFHSFLSNTKVFLFFLSFTFILTLALIWEWAMGMLDWKN